MEHENRWINYVLITFVHSREKDAREDGEKKTRRPRTEWKCEWKSFRLKCVVCGGGGGRRRRRSNGRNQQSFIILPDIKTVCLCIQWQHKFDQWKWQKHLGNVVWIARSQFVRIHANTANQFTKIRLTQMANAFEKVHYSLSSNENETHTISIAFERISVHWAISATTKKKPSPSIANTYCIVVFRMHSKSKSLKCLNQMTQKFMLKNDLKLLILNDVERIQWDTH